MLLLHISDIHFRAPQCLHPETDPDRGIRTRMVRHLQGQLARLGAVDVILVGGDIAFKADPAEYSFAKDWLLELSRICGCGKEGIFVIPGNHDVDRAAIARHVPTRNVHNAIASAQEPWRESVLRDQLSNEQTGGSLFHGHAAYNSFAATFNCQVYPDRLYWKADLPISGSVQLRIHGLTSTLLSGKDGANDPKDILYLSPMQTALDPVPDVVNMVMCHHPVDWLTDGDDVADALDRRSMLQLFGHKHRQRVHMDADFVRWGAGAVNPSRGEGPYEPGYNLIQLAIAGDGDARRLEVKTQQFTYQSNPERFDPIKTSRGADVFETAIPFPVDVVPSFSRRGGSPAIADTPPRAVGPDAPMLEMSHDGDAEAAMGSDRIRNIVGRFWDLDGSDRRMLALELGLISQEEISLPEPERYGKALLRAKERELIDALADRIIELESR